MNLASLYPMLCLGAPSLHEHSRLRKESYSWETALEFYSNMGLQGRGTLVRLERGHITMPSHDNWRCMTGLVSSAIPEESFTDLVSLSTNRSRAGTFADLQLSEDMIGRRFAHQGCG